jgi:predicted nucleotidyltransferase component of viral defense system
MISENLLIGWRKNAPWRSLEMIEQDLILNRALVSMYGNKKIRDNLIFRGGTALNKIYLKPAARYSEDLDFVQKNREMPGETMDAIRNSLDWLGKPKGYDHTKQSVRLVYRYNSINNLKMRVKIEINVAEHLQVMDIHETPFEFQSDWFSGSCNVSINPLEELMATKLRALYQRRKGRDLFDVWYVFSKKLADVEKTIQIFKKYCAKDDVLISEQLFRKNFELKCLNPDFRGDMNQLLPDGINWNFDEAFEYVQNEIINKI